jgi:hypothetical protein
MLCNGVALDEIGNEYKVDGSHKLICNLATPMDLPTSLLDFVIKLHNCKL